VPAGVRHHRTARRRTAEDAAAAHSDHGRSAVGGRARPRGEVRPDLLCLPPGIQGDRQGYRDQLPGLSGTDGYENPGQHRRPVQLRQGGLRQCLPERPREEGHPARACLRPAGLCAAAGAEHQLQAAGFQRHPHDAHDLPGGRQQLPFPADPHVREDAGTVQGLQGQSADHPVPFAGDARGAGQLRRLHHVRPPEGDQPQCRVHDQGHGQDPFHSDQPLQPEGLQQ